MADKRTIIFNGENAATAFGLVMSGSTPLTIPTPKRSALEIELSDGYIDTSRIDGTLHYSPRTIKYAFSQVLNVYDVEHYPSYDHVGGYARSTSEMQEIVIRKVKQIREWLFNDTTRKLYDTAYCNVLNQTGYYFDNVTCSGFNVSRSMSPDKWVLAYEVEFMFDPYLIELGAEPVTFATFAGPTDFSFSDGAVKIRFYNTGTNQRMAWVNDNEEIIGDVTYNGKYVQDGTTYYKASLTFKPPAKYVYSGPVGFYFNHFMTLFIDDTAYSYHVANLSVVSGNLTFISSPKIHTENEFGYTDQAGFQINLNIVADDGSDLDAMLADNNNKFVFSIIWGTATVFDTPLDQEYIIRGHVKGDQTFTQVTDTDHQGTIYYVIKNFDEPFQLDDDPFNELRMSTSSYGFYELCNPDVLRRSLV